MEVAATSSTGLRDDFLQLLVAQLRNQDPLDPVGQEEFTAQLAQFSVLEELEALNSGFEQTLEIQKQMMSIQGLAESSSIVDRVVTYQADEDEELETGRVSSVSIEDDKVYAHVGGEQLLISEIRAILSEAVPESTIPESTAQDLTVQNLSEEILTV